MMDENRKEEEAAAKRQLLHPLRIERCLRRDQIDRSLAYPKG